METEKSHNVTKKVKRKIQRTLSRTKTINGIRKNT